MLDTLFGQDYWLARLIFQRGLAIIYFFAFLAVLNQFLPLLGQNGLLPVPQFLRYISFNQAPSIFHFYYSDRLVTIIAGLGMIISLAILFGFSDKLPWWGTAGVWGILWILYLSIVNVGQTFYSFGWESMLLEAGFLAIIIGANKLAVPFVVILLLRWMLFRVEVGAGLIKIRGDECWRNLTCLDYHHETQPMPNPLSWYFHNFPAWMHRIEVLGNHFFQLIVPWFLFLPQPFAAISAGLIIVSQLWLILSGNFAWLNWMVIVLASSGFNNLQLGRIFALSPPAALLRPMAYQMIVVAATILIILLSWKPARNLYAKNQLMNASFNQYHLVNAYGAFGTVTKNRYEVVMQGTAEEVITPETKWQEYEFKGKPGDLKFRPKQYAPYHLRLDWLMWFLPFSAQVSESGVSVYGYEPWFLHFVSKLLDNDKATIALIRHNPFPDKPPKYVRALFYEYRFTTTEEKKENGAWWRRELKGLYFPPVSNDTPEFQNILKSQGWLGEK